MEGGREGGREGGEGRERWEEEGGGSEGKGREGHEGGRCVGCSLAAATSKTHQQV